MQTISLTRRASGYTLPELLIGSTICAVLAAGMLTTIGAMRKAAAASEHHANSQVLQARLIDYMSRDLRRALKVSVDSYEGSERLKVTIPDFYDATGGPREPIIDGSTVKYGAGEVPITYYQSGDTLYRTVNGAGTALATGLEKFQIDYTDDGPQAVTIAVSFVPRYQYGDADAETRRAATTTFATTLLRNKRQ